MGKLKIQYDVDGIEGLCLIEPVVYDDARGYSTETYNYKDFLNAGLKYLFVQDNQSMSVKGVLRGLHYQSKHPQAKLVRVIRGKVFDVAVDLRPGSPTFGRWHGEILSEENHRQCLIPKGFAHGFLVLSDTAAFCYKCDDFYHPDDEGGIAWNDPEIGIEWPLLEKSETGYTVDGTALILSEKDQKWLSLRETLPEQYALDAAREEPACKPLQSEREDRPSEADRPEPDQRPVCEKRPLR